MKKFLPLFGFLAAILPASATVYDVGPGFAKTRLRDVPWPSLNPGDVVNIHTTPGGYHEIIQISRTGTAAQHIVVHGVPDPVTGALPVLDGNGATTDPTVDWRASIFAKIGLIVVSPRASSYNYGVDHISFIDIENLDIRNALYTPDASIPLTDKNGVVQGWDSFACGIYVEWAHDLAIRGCEISNCCNGLFANSKNGPAQASARLLIEHNYFHDNSLPYTVDPNDSSKVLSNGYAEHHCYVESAGVTYQYNRFGRFRPNCHGVAIKDRSSGQVIRYNEFDMEEQSNVLALIDPQGGYGYLDTLPDFRDSYVYGNLITVEAYTSGMTLVWWGAYNSASSYAAEHRNVLHFYNNTVVNHHNGVSLFFLPSTNYMPAGATVQETVDCRNNVFFTDTSVQGNIYQAMRFSIGGATNGGGNIYLGSNWVSPGWRATAPGATWGGTLVGTNNLLVGDGMGANNPHFANISTRDYHVLSGSNVIDAAGPTGPGDPAVTEEYSPPQSSIPRGVLGSAPDLGAVESSGTPPLPPAGGAIAFSATSYVISENGGSAIITVNRTGGSTGTVSAVCASSNGTASSPADFTAGSASLVWGDGDLSPRTFVVPIVNDTTTEPAETVNLDLTMVSGGAGFGPVTHATLTINDDDVPVSQPIVAITGSGELVRFTSGAPGTILSNVAVTGITSPETMRGLAFRRSTGQLYVIGSTAGTGTVSATLYLLNPATAVLTAVAPLTLAHPSFDLGFDPVTDQLHLFGSTGQHLRIQPDTGAIIASDAPLSYAAGDAHSGAVPGIVGADFSPGLSPTAYGIDKTFDTLVRIGSPGGSPLNSSSGSVTTIGAIGKDAEGLTGLDFTPGGTAFAVLNAAADTSSNLYTIDTATGHAASLGNIGVAGLIRDLAVAEPGQIGLPNLTAEATEGDGTVTVVVTRTGGSWGQVSVDYTTVDGTAIAGSDYSATSGSLAWMDGEIGGKSIVIPVAADTLVEGDETFGVQLSSATNGALLAEPSLASVTIHERPYDAWKHAHFGDFSNDSAVAGDLAAPVGDGIANLLKYALGMNPDSSDPGGLPVAFNAGGFLTLAFSRAATDAQYQVEASGDFVTWDPVDTDITPPGSPPGWTEIRDTAPLGSTPRRFMRLRVTGP